MYRLTIASCLLVLVYATDADYWYSNALVYQIYPRSFKDSNGDGIGDLNGITSKLEHIAEIGANAFWLSPIYKSPQADFGYDISNYTDINPDYGTLADFDRLVAKANSLGLKVILDFVPNHTSDKHPWFQKSIQRIKPYDEYYVWRNGRIVNGTRQPPNNWLSNFQQSAWQWNNVRKQYYLHQFAPGQPDLNYHSPALDQEMKNVLLFWMNRGVNGFRIDVINHVFEDARLLDEPSANRTDLPKDDYDSLIHIYTRDQNESYVLLNSWRTLLQNHPAVNYTYRMLLTEAYTSHDLTIKYYDSGSTVPFNFMYITDLNASSTAADFKALIDKWLNSTVARNRVPNWVTGNHDNHRVATRFGSDRAEQILMLSMILPGVTVIYNGDEIGMVDRNFTYKETVDVAGCSAGPNRYYLRSRDPERTPYQWNNTTSAGFSNSSVTWLPVNSNYKTLNLDAQKSANVSHFKVFKALSVLKKNLVIDIGLTNVALINNNVLGVTRRVTSSVIALLINFSPKPITVNARFQLNLPTQMKVYTASVGSNIRPGSWINPMSVTLPGYASVVYISSNLFL